MKKLSIILALVFVLGICTSAFAAANPFVDVPAKHWAYDAVSKLAKAGIVDGYGDGTFRGDRNMTRYEMAQIVAKAMARSDKANAENKAIIDKLAVEFAAELNNLGVRVAKLEANQPNLKFNGDFRMRYTSYDDVPNMIDTQTKAQYRLRLDGKATIDEKSYFGMRFVTVDPYDAGASLLGLPKNNTWHVFGANSTGTNSMGIDRVYFGTKLGVVDTVVGRQQFVVGVTSGIVDAGAFSFDGIKLSTMLGEVKATANWGRLMNQVDVGSIELGTKYGKLQYGVGYFQVKDDASALTRFGINDITSKWTSTTKPEQKFKDVMMNLPKLANQRVGDDLMKLWYGYGIYNFDSKFSLTGEYSINKADYADRDNVNWTLIAVYGDQVLNKKGANNFKAQYYSVGANALGLDLDVKTGSGDGYHAPWILSASGLTTYDTTGTLTKFTGLDLSYNYAFSKNMWGEIHYVKLDDTTNLNTHCLSMNNDYSYWRALVGVKF